MRFYTLPNCCECGRFCVPADEGTYYGGPLAEEPPDPAFFCPKCAGVKMREAMFSPERVIARCWWLKPDYVRVAKSVLRHHRKIPPSARA